MKAEAAIKWSFLAAMIFALCGCTTTPAARPMRLVVTGEPGTMFTARFKADGVVQEQTALMPATIPFIARNVEWNVTVPNGNRNFRVELYVGNLMRLSTASSGRKTIEGVLNYSNNQEKYWAHTVE